MFESFFPAIIGVLLVILFLSFFTVQEQTILIVQRFGSFLKMATAGLNIKIPIIDQIAGRVNLRVQQLDVKVETKTEDNVFIHVTVSVQYRVHEDRVYEAFYKLQNPQEQITSFVFDVVRARVPKIKLDDVFEKKDEVANSVMEELAQMMNDFGYLIVKALVTDIEPDSKVKAAMNEINAAQRMRIAANEKGEAERILKVKSAQGDAESKALQGQGVANQRKAIVDGLRDSIVGFKEGIPDSSAQEVMNLVLMTQYFDMLKELGATSQTNTVLIPHSPGAVGDLTSQIRNAVIAANRAEVKPVVAGAKILPKHSVSSSVAMAQESDAQKQSRPMPNSVRDLWQ